MTIYQKIKRISKPIVKHYLEDVTVHDRAACRKMRDGSIALWNCRTCGSHFVWVNHPEDTVDHETLESLRLRLNYFDAIAGDHWYMLEQIGQSVIPINTDQARDLFVSRLRAIEGAVKRLAA